MSEFTKQIITWATRGAVFSLVAGVAGVFGQAVSIAFGAVEQPLLIGVFGTLITGGMTGLIALATLVWRSEKNGG